MNNEKLSEELLEHALPEGFQEELLQRTVRIAARRDQVRQGAAAVVTMAVVMVVFFAITRPAREVDFVMESGPMVRVATKPVASFKLIVTTPMESKLATGTLPPVPRLTTRKESFVLVETTPAFMNGVVQVSDDELFRLLDGKAIALFRAPGREAELLLLDERPLTEQSATP